MKTIAEIKARIEAFQDVLDIISMHPNKVHPEEIRLLLYAKINDLNKVLLP